MILTRRKKGERKSKTKGEKRVMARRSKEKKNRSKHERAHREKAICIETYSNISECERINNKTSIIPISFN